MPKQYATNRPWHDNIEFQAGRSKFKGYLAVPEGGDVPGVILIHAWWGVTGFFRGVCDRLADEGFVVLAPDLYGGKTASTIPEAKKLRSHLKTFAVKKELDSAVDLLGTLFAVSGERIGVVGFSLGAYWGMWLAEQRPNDVAAVSAFYGLRRGNYKKTQAKFQAHLAENDEWAPMKSVKRWEAQMRSAGKELSVHTYPETKHWFFEKDRADAYQPAAAQLAWDRTTAFLHKNLDFQ